MRRFPSRFTVLREVIDYLEEQPEKCIEDGRCQYRKNDGNKCAIGFLIPDDKYMPEIENRLICYIIGEYGWQILGWEEPQTNEEGQAMIKLLDILQMIHDRGNLDKSISLRDIQTILECII